MNRTVTHKHLKREMNDFEEDNERIKNLLLELKFSTLLMPAEIVGEDLEYPTVDFGERKYAPLFTDVYEYEKIDFNRLYPLTVNCFDFYLDLLNDDVLEGLIIDVESDRLPITREFIEILHSNPVFDYERQVLTASQIKEIKDSSCNIELDEFLANPANFWDYESLMKILLKSNLYTVILSGDDLSENAQNGVIQLKTDKMPFALSGSPGFEYGLIFTSPEEIKINRKSRLYPYMQLVNLPEFIKSLLEHDLDGFIINENSQNITIPREYLLKFLNDLKTPDTCKYDDYAFVIE